MEPPHQLASVEAICFDLDDTLFDWSLCREEGFNRVFEALQDNPFGIDPRQYMRTMREHFDPLWDEFHAGQISAAVMRFQRFYRPLCSLADNQGADEQLRTYGQKLSDVFYDTIKKKTYLMPGAGQVVNRLGEVFRLAILTNGFWEIQLAKLKQPGWHRDRFEFIHCSDKLGLTKPDAAAFEAVAHDFDLPPAKILMVGNSLASDITGAHQAGLHTCWYKPRAGSSQLGCPASTWIIHDLRELLKLLPDAR